MTIDDPFPSIQSLQSLSTHVAFQGWESIQTMRQSLRKPTNLLLPGLKDNIITSGSIITAAGHHLQWQKVICFLRQLETKELRNNEITYSAAIVSCELATHEAAENKDPVCSFANNIRRWKNRFFGCFELEWKSVFKEVYTAVKHGLAMFCI